MMRRGVWLACVASMPLVVAGCGGDTADTGKPATTMAPAATATTMMAPTADDEEAYELDVIAEAEPDEGAPPLEVRFSASVEEEEGGPWTFSWDFGDGTTSTEQNPVHTYQKVGEYTATLVVTDSRGYKGTDEIDIFVETEDQFE